MADQPTFWFMSQSKKKKAYQYRGKWTSIKSRGSKKHLPQNHNWLPHIGNSTLTFLLYPLTPAALPLNLNLCGSKSTYDKISLLTKLFLSPFVVLVLRTMLDSPSAIFANQTRVTSPSYKQSKQLRNTSTSYVQTKASILWVKLKQPAFKLCKRQEENTSNYKNILW